MKRTYILGMVLCTEYIILGDPLSYQAFIKKGKSLTPNSNSIFNGSSAEILKLIPNCNPPGLYGRTAGSLILYRDGHLNQTSTYLIVLTLLALFVNVHPVDGILDLPYHSFEYIGVL